MGCKTIEFEEQKVRVRVESADGSIIGDMILPKSEADLIPTNKGLSGFGKVVVLGNNDKQLKKEQFNKELQEARDELYFKYDIRGTTDFALALKRLRYILGDRLVLGPYDKNIKEAVIDLNMFSYHVLIKLSPLKIYIENKLITDMNNAYNLKDKSAVYKEDNSGKKYGYDDCAGLFYGEELSILISTINRDPIIVGHEVGHAIKSLIMTYYQIEFFRQINISQFDNIQDDYLKIGGPGHIRGTSEMIADMLGYYSAYEDVSLLFKNKEDKEIDLINNYIQGCQLT